MITLGTFNAAKQVARNSKTNGKATTLTAQDEIQ